MLKFNPKWRYEAPSDGVYITQEIPKEANWDFDKMIGKIRIKEGRWTVLETFKAAFVNADGGSHHPSSNESWAESDLMATMGNACKNAPLYIEAFYDACLKLKEEDNFVPDVDMINEICQKHNIGFFLQPPNLLLREDLTTTMNPVSVEEVPPTLEVAALETYQKSLARSEELLANGNSREAVQEILWLLESVATIFKGVETGEAVIKGKYFNEIVKELKKSNKGTVLERVMEWLSALHGFLSSPTGGTVRHGMDLKSGISIGKSEARLFCNLVKSYIGYLLSEHERLKDKCD